LGRLLGRALGRALGRLRLLVHGVVRLRSAVIAARPRGSGDPAYYPNL